MDPLTVIKPSINPWEVYSIFEFSYFCCPECDSKLAVKQDFINHASQNHPWVSLIIYSLCTKMNIRCFAMLQSMYNSRGFFQVGVTDPLDTVIILVE